VHIEREAGDMVGTLRIRVQALNLMTLMASLFAFGVVLLYGFVENFAPR
jgi:hypothetical protein